MEPGTGTSAGTAAARTFRVAVAAEAVFVGVLAVVFLGGLVQGPALRWVGNLTTDAAAIAATAACVFAARYTAGRARAGWSAVSVGVGGWTAGNLVWSYYELVAGREAGVERELVQETDADDAPARTPDGQGTPDGQ